MMSSPNTLQFKKPLKGLSIDFWGNASMSLNEARRKEKEAFTLGLEQAKAEAQEEIKALKQSQTDFFSNMNTQFEELASSINERLPKLVIGITQKVLGNIEPLQENIINLVNEAIQEAPEESRHLKVILSEADHNCIQENIASIQSSNASLKFEINNSLKSGDCLIQSDFGLIDAKTSTKLKKIEESLIEQ